MPRTRRPIAILLALLLSVAALSPLHAQFDPGELNIHQNGALVGSIFVPDRDPDACIYWEFWFVFDSYRYPGSDPELETTFEVTDEAASETLSRMRAGDGHWITVQAFEQRPECRQ